MGSSNNLSLWLRWSGLALGALTFFWFPIEDTNTTALTVLGLSWSAWGAAWWGTRHPERLSRAGQTAAVGLLAGVFTLPVGMLLVVIKAGLHAHGFLDFSTTQLRAYAARTPLWAVLGALAGWLMYRFISSRTDPSAQE